MAAGEDAKHGEAETRALRAGIDLGMTLIDTAEKIERRQTSR